MLILTIALVVIGLFYVVVPSLRSKPGYVMFSFILHLFLTTPRYNNLYIIDESAFHIHFYLVTLIEQAMRQVLVGVSIGV